MELDLTSRRNLLILAQLRWLAVCGQVVTLVVVNDILGIELPLVPMAGVILFLIALNVVAMLRHQQATVVTHGELLLALLLDVAALTIQLYLSGGASNPFISLFLLQVILAAVLLETWSVWLVVVVSTAGFVWLTTDYMPIPIPSGGRHDLFDLHIQGMFICFLLAACLLVIFVGMIQRNLKARDVHLADLRQRALEEDHVVRMGLLASGAAHELGTPLAILSVILGDWRHLPAFSDDPDLGRELAEMQAQVDRCKAIVSDVLLNAGEARGEGAYRTTLARFLDETVGEWRGSRSPPALDYTCVIAEDVAIISDTALKQVIFNILDNALEASPGWVGIAAGRRDKAMVITVTDAGPGFKPEILTDFGKPYRSSKGRVGSGVGLFLVVNLIRKLGGSVEARNGMDGGASVTLTLPLSSLALGAGDAAS